MAEKPKTITELNTNDKTKAKDGKSLPSKFFMHRESLLTDLFKNEHIQMMYNISMVIFLSLVWTNFLHDFLKHGEINLGQKYVFKAFGKWHVVLFIWNINFMLSMLCFPSFRLWARVRLTLNIKSSKSKLWDKIWIVLTVIFYVVMLYLPAHLLLKASLPVMSRIVVLCESIRFVMKSHAFIRSSAPKILGFKAHSEQKNPIPQFSSFIYFWFAPTLVYQDEYPRTTEIRWKYVIKYFVDFIVSILFAGVISQYFMEPLDQICIEKITWVDILILVFKNALFGLLLTLIFFYLFLHSWLNAFAELLQFGDRLFYKDWWTSTSYQRFYRTWNSVVHDWLYTYILKDCYEFMMPRNKAMSRIVVLLVSAVFHEYILCLTLDFFFPVFLVNYVVPSLIFWIVGETKHWMANWAVLYAQGLGVSMFLVMYTIEYNVRQNCEPLDSFFYNYITPAVFRCKCLS